MTVAKFFCKEAFMQTQLHAVPGYRVGFEHDTFVDVLKEGDEWFIRRSDRDEFMQAPAEIADNLTNIVKNIAFDNIRQQAMTGLYFLVYGYLCAVLK